jgi:anti-anti-sigma factor
LTIVNLKGRLPAEPDEFDVALLSTVLCDMVNVGKLDLALNLCGLTHIDPRGLATLAMMTNIIHDASGHVTLVAPSARVARMLAVTRLDDSVVEWDEPGAVPV